MPAIKTNIHRRGTEYTETAGIKFFSVFSVPLW